MQCNTSHGGMASQNQLYAQIAVVLVVVKEKKDEPGPQHKWELKDVPHRTAARTSRVEPQGWASARFMCPLYFSIPVCAEILCQRRGPPSSLTMYGEVYSVYGASLPLLYNQAERVVSSGALERGELLHFIKMLSRGSRGFLALTLARPTEAPKMSFRT